MTTVTEDVRADGAAVLGQVMNTLQEAIGPQRYNAWFRHGTHVSLADGHVKVAVPNPFVANWIETHYHGDLAAAVRKHTGRELPILVSVDPQLSASVSRRGLDLQAEMVSRVTQGRARQRAEQAEERRPKLKYDLGGFVVGESNVLAYNAALAVARQDNEHMSQLFLHGPCGVGKTHLLQGICQAASQIRRRDGKPLAWRYVTGEQFTNEFIVAVRHKGGSDFRKRYRNLDLLAVDDVHFLAAKRATQDEFLHTFNAIQSAGKRILLASDTHPRLVGDLNEQLVSRFLAGMVVKIDAPDETTRMQILRRKAESMRLDADGEVLRYIATHIRGSVRELEGTLVKLSALAALEDGPLTLEMARDALSDHLARSDSATTVGDIEAVVATFFGVTPADIQSSRRTKTVSTARMIAMYLARQKTNMSYPEIGRFMGKNHSSVVLAVQRCQQALDKKDRLTWSTPAGPREMPARQLVEMLDGQVG